MIAVEGPPPVDVGPGKITAFEALTLLVIETVELATHDFEGDAVGVISGDPRVVEEAARDAAGLTLLDLEPAVDDDTVC